jgi:SAM-dependent methyltransferase
MSRTLKSALACLRRHHDRMHVTDRSSVVDFVLVHLPPPPAPVLEVGAGRGDLARYVVARGYSVTAIDPEPPEGADVERVAIADFDTAESFAAVITSRVLHHVVDLDVALDRIASLLDPGGVIVVHEFAWDRVVGATARWLFEALRGQRSPDRPSTWDSLEDWYAAWVDEHAGLHGFRRLVTGLDVRFTRQWFGWVPYLASEYVDPGLEPSERALIESGVIQASAFRYVGRRSGE